MFCLDHSLKKMSSEGVRVSAATRRKPQQSRARASSEALQEAFVRVLIEQGFARVTVREVAAVAGVGIGTFYEYVGNKEALAALTIHIRVKGLAQALLAGIQASQHPSAVDLAMDLIDGQIQRVNQDAPSWAALFLLERQISAPDAYRKHYDQFVALWAQALTPVLTGFPASEVHIAARTVHGVVYGLVSQELITVGAQADLPHLGEQIKNLVRPYLLSILGRQDVFKPI